MSNGQEHLTFHRSLFVFDGFHNAAWDHRFLEQLRLGGYKAVHRSIPGTNDPKVTIRKFEKELNFITSEKSALALVHSSAEMEVLSRENRVSVVLGLEGTDALDGDWRLLPFYKRLGVEIVQLTHNRRNWLGDGCTERTNCGISDLGVKFVKELNKLRMVVDCAHAAEATALDAIELSGSPVIISHANARKLRDSPRNVSDRVLQAMAKKGGVVGVTPFAHFLRNGEAKLFDVLDHIDYIRKLVGVDHVGLGFAIPEGRDIEKEVGELDRKVYKPSVYPDLPWKYAEGLDRVANLPNLTKGLLERGYARDEIGKIMGGNFLRVLRDVWGK